MKLNHLNLTVPNVTETKGFLEKHFGLRPMSGAPNSEAISILNDDQGMVLTLMRPRDGEVRYPDSFHIGFIQPSEDRVNGINQQLKDDGFDVPPPRRFHGSWTFYFQAPGGFTIEVMG